MIDEAFPEGWDSMRAIRSLKANAMYLGIERYLRVFVGFAFSSFPQADLRVRLAMRVISHTLPGGEPAMYQKIPYTY